MDENTVKNMIKEMLPNACEHDKNYHAIKPIYDIANSKIHYQSDPYVNDVGEVVVKRLYSIDVKVEKVHQLVEEYITTTKY